MNDIVDNSPSIVPEATQAVPATAENAVAAVVTSSTPEGAATAEAALASAEIPKEGEHAEPAPVSAEAASSAQEGEPTAGAPSILTEDNAPAPAVVSSRPKNALSHGIYAQDMVLAWEDPDELQKLRDQIWAELKPEGRMQEETALGIVRLYWLKRRLMIGSHAMFSSRHRVMTSSQLLKFIEKEQEDTDSLFVLTKNAVKTVKETAEGVSANLKGQPPEVAQTCTKLQEIADYIERDVLQRIDNLERERRLIGDSYDKTNSVVHMEPMLCTEASLDARIDKQMGRFVTLQEYQKMRVAKEALPLSSK